MLDNKVQTYVYIVLGSSKVWALRFSVGSFCHELTGQRSKPPQKKEMAVLKWSRFL